MFPAFMLVFLPASMICLLVPLFIFFGRPARPSDPQVYGFFHPYCSGGGGGERVLWKMIQVLQQQGKRAVIYTIDPPDTDEARLRQDASKRFDVSINKPVHLVSLEEYRDFLRPAPFLSLVLESFGTMKLAYQGLLKHPEIDVFCDTTGCAFTFLVARCLLPRAYILSYVHYPTISTDMMLWEWKKNPRRGKLKTVVKLVYYWIFAIAYGLVGSLADLVMVNSTWTLNHIQSLWRFSKQIYIVYPPCRVPNDAVDNHAESDKRSNTIVSIGQFRPEKDHPLQVEALAKLLKEHPEHHDVTLMLIGSCRNDGDRKRVDALRAQVEELGLAERVHFSINPPYSKLQQSMQIASMGIHTMRQEHFGIGIVEMMAAGLLTIAHNSGGPKSDIVEPGITGYLAVTAEEYANAIHHALTLKDTTEMRRKAQASATRFSDQVFEISLKKVLPKLTCTR